jgi:prolyl oligopeptidase
MDMLRKELHPNSAFTVTEFGTVKDREQFKALHAYSRYYNVQDGIAYPATLLTSGENDSRVDAYQPKKMAARLQAATSGHEPILLRIKPGGHRDAESPDEIVAELRDLYTFIFDRVGIAYR